MDLNRFETACVFIPFLKIAMTSRVSSPSLAPRDCLFLKKRTMANMKQIRSYKHQLYTVNLNKIGLSSYDDKRYICDDGVTTLAHGHRSVTLTDEDQQLVDILVSLT